eukprot:TRINITY_DN400_c0_g1_i3.p1 TRINITY_DN400_c0_g1~~TRINITY_DN400_c0_g1_i3.p1  ORF type:complete len:226 (+),score=20.90 TRINITY_DN400_c0_g1_i3:122-799(+)
MQGRVDAMANPPLISASLLESSLLRLTSKPRHITTASRIQVSATTEESMSSFSFILLTSPLFAPLRLSNSLKSLLNSGKLVSSKKQSLDCEVLGCSVDSVFSHMEYNLKPKDEGGLGGLEIPLIGDLSKDIAESYGVLVKEGENKGAAFRATFIIDTKGTIRHKSINDLPVGRNVDEVLRLVKAFQFVDTHGEVCPASWKPGDPTMVGDHESSKTKDYWKKVHTK